MATKHSVFIHPSSIVASPNIGANTRIWQFCVVEEGVSIGRDCNICFSVYLERGVSIGDNVVIKNHVSIWNGITIASNVFIGAGVVFTNDKYPMAGDRTKPLLPTIVESGATIGAGAVILPGFTIGSNSMVAAGAVVTRNIEAGEVFISKIR